MCGYVHNCPHTHTYKHAHVLTCFLYNSTLYYSKVGPIHLIFLISTVSEGMYFSITWQDMHECSSLFSKDYAVLEWFVAGYRFKFCSVLIALFSMNERNGFSVLTRSFAISLSVRLSIWGMPDDNF